MKLLNKTRILILMTSAWGNLGWDLGVGYILVRDHGGHGMASLSEKQLCFGHQNAAKLALAVL